MAWEHTEIGQTGFVTVISEEKPTKCEFEIGSITTGRQRVFHRHFVAIHLPDGTRVEGRDPRCIAIALANAAELSCAAGYRLFAVALDPRFYESGLSFNSSWGYVEGYGPALHMMDAPPYPRVPTAQWTASGMSGTKGVSEMG